LDSRERRQRRRFNAKCFSEGNKDQNQKCQTEHLKGKPSYDTKLAGRKLVEQGMGKEQDQEKSQENPL
jgi:hypothetical protein